MQPHSFVVVIPTYRRPRELERCLQHALKQVDASSVVVVDASPDRESEEIVKAHSGVRYLRNTDGLGHLPGSRRIGVEATASEVVVFLDDDVLVRPGYVDSILSHYDDPGVGGVGGRLAHGVAGEEKRTTEPIARFLPDTKLTGGFTVDTGGPITVDHLMGATMSYRRSALEQVGGIRDIYPGTGLREDSDNSLRVAAGGWKLIYEPAALADHIPARYARGKRFDARYTFYSARNHLVLMTSVFGIKSHEFRAASHLVFGSMVLGTLRGAFQDPGRGAVGRLRHVLSRTRHAVAAALGGIAGLAASLRLARRPPI